MTIEGKSPVRKKRAKLPAPRKRRLRKYLRSDERREHILAAAREVFVRVGPQGARTRDLAEAAGINQATMFSHFESKEAIFTAAVVEPLQAAMQNARERGLAFRDSPSGEARNAVSHEAASRILQSAHELYPMLAVGLFANRESGERLYVNHIYPMLRERGEAIKASLRETVDSELLSIAIFGIALAFCADRAFRGLPLDVDELASQMSNLVLFGCAPDKYLPSS